MKDRLLLLLASMAIVLISYIGLMALLLFILMCLLFLPDFNSQHANTYFEFLMAINLLQLPSIILVFLWFEYSKYRHIKIQKSYRFVKDITAIAFAQFFILTHLYYKVITGNILKIGIDNFDKIIIIKDLPTRRGRADISLSDVMIIIIIGITFYILVKILNNRNLDKSSFVSSYLAKPRHYLIIPTPPPKPPK